MELKVKHYDELTVNELYEILKARSIVFVVEQNCPYLDPDGKDKVSYHVWLENDDGSVEAYLRVIPVGVSCEENSIGRVITVHHGRGYGNIIMKEGIRVAKEKFDAKAIRIHAQAYARGYYEKHGFRVTCEETFLEDDIPHLEMLWEADKQ